MIGIAVPPIHTQVGQGTGDGVAFLVIGLLALVALVAWVLVAWSRGRIRIDTHLEERTQTDLPAAA